MGDHTHNGSRFSEGTPDQLARVVSATADWLAANGIRVASTRLERCREILAGFSKATADDRQLEFSREVGRDHLYNAISEGNDWRLIYAAFGAERPDRDLRGTLKKAIGGPEFPHEEQKTEARDYQFELTSAAVLKLSGYGVQFDGDSDLYFALRDWRIFVECKRAQHGTTVVKKAHAAERQLEKRYRDWKGPSRGIVMLSVTKVLGDPRVRPAYLDWGQMRHDLREDADSVINLLGNNRRAADPHTIGVVVSLQRVGWVEPGPFIVTAGEMAFQAAGLRYGLDTSLFEEIAGRVRAADLDRAGLKARADGDG